MFYLRRYPAISEVYREWVMSCPLVAIIANTLQNSTKKDMVLPLSEPIRGVDGTWMKEIPIPKDTRILVSIRGSNRDKSVWGEDAHEWKPERWLSPLPESVTDARIPGVYSNM